MSNLSRYIFKTAIAISSLRTLNIIICDLIEALEIKIAPGEAAAAILSDFRDFVSSARDIIYFIFVDVVSKVNRGATYRASSTGGI